MNIGPTENHDLVIPKIHKIGWLSRLAFRSGLVTDRSIQGFPSIRRYWRRFQEADPEVVIVRGVTRWFCRLAALYAIVQRRTLVIYDQEPVTSRRWTSTWFRREVFKWLGIVHFTPRIDESGQAGTDTGRARPLPFGCPFPTASTQAWGTRPLGWPPRLLMVAKYRDRKGHANLLAALAQVASEVQFTITFCGEEASTADHEYRKALSLRATELGIGDRVTFLRNVPNSQMGELYASHDLFVLPSYAEPAAVSPIEAAWAGCAVLLSRDSGTRGYFPAGVEYDFDANTPDDIARALRNILKAPEVLTRARHKVRRHLEYVCGRDRILTEFERFLPSRNKVSHGRR